MRYAHAKFIQQKHKKGTKFQKKLVVIRHMGAHPPTTFTIKEDLILIRGILPELEYTSSERHIRNTIADTINGYTESDISLDSFEFLEAAGKRLCVPAKSPELQWTGRALKELAGSGSIYVRLTLTESESSESIESDSVNCSSPELKIVKIETPGTIAISL